MDEARVKARLERATRVPGPGAYDVKRPASTGREIAGSYAFKSKTERKPDETLKEVGDPGLYNPYEGASLAANMSKSFNKSQQSGSGNFGTRTKRAELSVPNDAPGPGTYDAKEPAKPEAKQGSAFASQTKRGAYVRKEVTPGAGEYDPATNTRKITGGDSMFKNKDDRFKKNIELEQQAHVGPGSYAQGQMTIKSEVGKTASKLGAAFNTTAKKEWDMSAGAGDTPGPGSYNASRPSGDGVALAGSSAFKSKTERKPDETLKEVGDPGLYNPYEGASLAANMSKSFNKSQQSGSGNFGTRTKRAELSVPNDAPGPGTYDAKEPAKPEAKQGSAFASQTKRGAYVRKEVTPGAGEYDPKAAADKVAGGDSMFKNKDMRFKKSAELEQQAHVGPGSYQQTDFTVEKNYNSNVGKISSAFASTVLRDSFL